MISKDEYKRIVHSEIEHLDSKIQLHILKQLNKELDTHETNFANIETLGSPLKFIERAKKPDLLTKDVVIQHDTDTQNEELQVKTSFEDSNPINNKKDTSTSSNALLLVVSLFVSIPIYLVLFALTLALWLSSLTLTISGIWLLLFNHLPLNIILWVQDKATNSLLGIAFILVGIGFSMVAQRGFSGLYHGIKWLSRAVFKGNKL